MGGTPRIGVPSEIVWVLQPKWQVTCLPTGNFEFLVSIILEMKTLGYVIGTLLKILT